MVLLLAAPCLVMAQDWGFQTGDWALTLQGSGTSDDDVDNTTLSIDAGLGYSLTDAFEVGIRQ